MQIQGMGSMMFAMGMRGSGPPSAAEMSERIISNKDIDGDGAINFEEFGMSQDKFNAADTDSDGLISKDELLIKVSERMAIIGGPQIMAGAGPDPSKIYEKILSSKDQDDDGALSISELDISEEAFAALDTNEDGVINSEEFEANIAKKISSTRQPEMEPDVGWMAKRIMSRRDEDYDEQLTRISHSYAF